MRHPAALLPLALLLLGATATAAPPAPAAPAAPPALEVRVDLDGDGAPDLVRLERDRVRATTAAGRPLYERRLPPAAGTPRLRALTVAGIPVVEARVPVRGPRGAEEVVVLRGRPFAEVFAGRAGPMGRDGEWSRHLSVDEHSILEFQRAVSVTRCDDEPVFLFPRLYDFAAGRFRAAAPAAPPPAPVRVTARRVLPGAPAGAPLARFVPRSASSALGDEGRAENLAPPVAVADGDVRTAWVAGASGPGRGQFVTLQGTPGAYRVHALRIVPGHGAGRDAFLAHHRLRRAAVILGPTASVEAELPPELSGADAAGAAYWIVLPAPVATTCVTVRIDDVYPAAPVRPGRGAAAPALAGAGHAAIAEIQVYTELDFAGGVERLVTDLLSGQGGTATQRLVVAQGARAVAPLVAALARARGEARTRVLEALADVAPPELAGLLAESLGGPERDSAAAARGLRRLGLAAAPALRALLVARDRPAAARAAAAPLLAQSGDPAALGALIAALAAGDAEVRDAAVQALMTADAATVLAAAADALAATPAPARPAELMRVIANAAPGAPPSSPPRQRAADALLGVAPRIDDFEGRFRLARAAGAVGGARLAPILETLLADRDPEIRMTATVAAAELPAAAAAALLGRALGDVAPEVRRAAVTQLGRRRDLPEQPALSPLVAQDRWPMVRRAAAEALGVRCRGAGPALGRAVARDPVVDVAEAAVRGLVSCRDPEAAAVLLATVENGRRPPRLRETAAAGLAALGDRAATPRLASLLDDLRTQPGSDDQIEALAVTLARALGRLGDERGLRALRQASIDPASASLRVAALEAIATICPAGARAVLEQAGRDPDPRVVQAARAALGRCRR
ncbi:MAG TPA: HEAT repeat domain-containing protein [Polyangia bacterium]